MQLPPKMSTKETHKPAQASLPGMQLLQRQFGGGKWAEEAADTIRSVRQGEAGPLFYRLRGGQLVSPLVGQLQTG